MTLEPPATPTDNPPPAARNKTRRTLLLWVVLILMFLAIYAMFEDSGKPADSAAPAVSPDLASAVQPWIWPTVLVAVFAAYFLMMRRIGRSSRELLPGLLARQDGDHARAASVFADVARRYEHTVGVGTSAAYNLAQVLEDQGDLAGAEAALARVERWPALAYAGSLRFLTAVALVRLCALRGDTARARRWLEDARRRAAKGEVEAALHRPQLFLAEIVLLGREGRSGEAIELCTQREEALECLSYRDLRLVWAVCAFVAASEAGPREHAVADRWLRRLRAGARDGDLAHAVGAWPELRAFLIAHELGAAVEATGPAAAAS